MSASAPTTAIAATVPAASAARPSQVIAEALVERQGPRQIVSRAAALGLSCQLTQAIVAACCATAVDPTRANHRRPCAAA